MGITVQLLNWKITITTEANLSDSGGMIFSVPESWSFIIYIGNSDSHCACAAKVCVHIVINRNHSVENLEKKEREGIWMEYTVQVWKLAGLSVLGTIWLCSNNNLSPTVSPFSKFKAVAVEIWPKLSMLNRAVVLVEELGRIEYLEKIIIRFMSVKASFCDGLGF